MRQNTAIVIVFMTAFQRKYLAQILRRSAFLPFGSPSSKPITPHGLSVSIAVSHASDR